LSVASNRNGLRNGMPRVGAEMSDKGLRLAAVMKTGQKGAQEVFKGEAGGNGRLNGEGKKMGKATEEDLGAKTVQRKRRIVQRSIKKRKARRWKKGEARDMKKHTKATKTTA
jgi:hypothetical protein